MFGLQMDKFVFSVTYSGSAKIVAEKKTRRRDADECDRDGRAPQHRKCVAMTFLEPLYIDDDATGGKGGAKMFDDCFNERVLSSR